MHIKMLQGNRNKGTVLSNLDMLGLQRKNVREMEMKRLEENSR